jgi:hypothetical protein
MGGPVLPATWTMPTSGESGELVVCVSAFGGGFEGLRISHAVEFHVMAWIANGPLRRSRFTNQERKDYIHAVLCLQTLPSKLNSTLVPGARTRYDDFVGVHINQTMSIHLTVGYVLQFYTL